MCLSPEGHLLQREKGRQRVGAINVRISLRKNHISSESQGPFLFVNKIFPSVSFGSTHFGPCFNVVCFGLVSTQKGIYLPLKDLQELSYFNYDGEGPWKEGVSPKG